MPLAHAHADTSPHPFRASVAGLLLLAGAVACNSETTVDSKQRERQLEALGYLATTPDSDERSGLISYDRDRAIDGVNLFLTHDDHQVWLVDMDGTLLHRWSLGAKLAHAELDVDGALLALVKDRGLFKLDERSRVLWSASTGAHHDVEITDEGYIVLSRDIRRVPSSNGLLPILEDRLVWIDEHGVKQRELLLYPLFSDDVPGKRYARIREFWEKATAKGRSPVPEADPRLRDRMIMRGTPYDVFHTNSLELIHRKIEGVAEPGDLLISVREIDTLAVIDPEGPTVRWRWGRGELEEQHHASLLDDDRILLFDNGVRRGRSRVLEVDPRAKKILWKYDGPQGGEFFSEKRSSAQRLPGGNTLIALGDLGRLMEVTREGEVVWEYWLPKANEGERQATYRVERFVGERAEKLRQRFGSGAD